ncbi:MAG: DEAD/DEAH box helicase [Phycisphaerales bacterium]|nr:DEAD/DEAH box helicase [Phycisphaerales bacterium]
MDVLHGIWSRDALNVWAEAESDAENVPTSHAPGADGVMHAFAAGPDRVASLLRAMHAHVNGAAPVELRLMLPGCGGRPTMSPGLAHAIGHAAHDDEGDVPTLAEFRVPALALGPKGLLTILSACDGWEDSPSIRMGRSLRYWCVAGRFARYLITHQRLVPMLLQTVDGGLAGVWQPWLVDDEIGKQASLLTTSMPPVVRSVVDPCKHEPWPILRGFLQATVDAAAREALLGEQMEEVIEGRDADADSHVAWLAGLLGDGRFVAAPNGDTTTMLRTVRHWIAQLDEHGQDAQFRLCIQLVEPSSPGLADLQAPGDSILWTMRFSLQSVDDVQLSVDAEEIWAGPGDAQIIDGHRIENPHELLLAELGRASRVYPKLEDALDESTPTSLRLTTRETYQFLREYQPLLIESEFAVDVPRWWNNPAARLGARLIVESDEQGPGESRATGTGSMSSAQIGLQSLVKYSWQIALGDHVLTLQEFEALAKQGAPLVRAGNQWVEVRPEDMAHAMNFIAQNPGGETTVLEAIRLAYASDAKRTGLSVLGMTASGWVGRLFGDTVSPQRMEMLETPEHFHGELRPYQEKGLSWLVFLDRFGFGACLADDMGLGKTIQLLALLLHERRLTAVGGDGRTGSAAINPTLLIVPMSVVNNWVRETNRFAPSLRVLVHHGPERLAGSELAHAVGTHDIVVTTYALAHRDVKHLRAVNWGRIVLDEAQNVKNPSSKQAAAIRSLNTERRVALTGTPVENRLQELWSIIDFLNPGYLGKLGEFRRQFALPIERYHKKDKAVRLRGMVQPFVLRRLKTDPTVIADLPEKIETKEYVQLTSEQATLYEQTVEQMLSSVDRAQGIRRRGVVLATLVKLKQICNHPAQLFKETAHGQAIDARALSTGPPPDVTRSCKTIRIGEILEELIAEGDQALVFTQFRQMGHILAAMLRHELDREILFMHGGVSVKARQRMIDQFQSRDASTPIFVLSLKAGGFGLNLTAANHVIHFDRWWNPAVENQATDRAFRIGQTRTVFVHKFICTGTLEERIDRMIEHKLQLADNIVGSGEQWLTELDTKQLRELLELRPGAVNVDME